ASPVNDDLDALERSMRQLQVEWEKFFGGVEKKPPNELKVRVEALVRKYAYAEIRNNTERFRYQTLSSRYATFNELWNKRLRAIEEGRPVGLHGIHERHAPPPPPFSPTPVAARGGSGEVRVKDPSGDAEAMRSLFDRFLEARKAAGDAAPVRFESFQKIISQQAARILSEKGAQAVDFRLETKDGKVSLKAKPVK
ncbi:MAG TPA: MXAN_5187 C-terminal domain-containing protein, partial [Vicinamibacteria bacterium]|nr:MXAN_5187 C-terminal domain-containing protein [Vicinamibacteria bacterium]